jgi:hypothetical protein
VCNAANLNKDSHLYLYPTPFLKVKVNTGVPIPAVFWGIAQINSIPKAHYTACPLCSANLLFGEVVRMQRLSNLYESVDALSAKYGKHTLFLTASLPSHLHAQHAGDRGELPERQVHLLPGETRRKRLGIPLLLGEV